VQSFDNENLTMLGRAHDADEAREAVAILREAGLTNLGLDLIWGLPGQSAAEWLATVRAALELAPEHLSCYALTLEPGTRLAASVGDLPPLPDDDVLKAMFLEGAELLENAGYIHYEVANFARPGCESRHNQGYWAGRDYLGLGPAAVSTLDGQRWTNPTDLASHAQGVADWNLESAEELSPRTKHRERIMLGLRTARGIPEDVLTGKPGAAAFVQSLLDTGLARQDNGRLALTRQGMLLADEVAARVLGL
jgi:oxygen-independent coproporphyrinogen-3 oxidase